VLRRIADGDAHLDDLFDLDGATNDRLRGQMGFFDAQRGID
jgi:hypothetical protein